MKIKNLKKNKPLFSQIKKLKTDEGLALDNEYFNSITKIILGLQKLEYETIGIIFGDDFRLEDGSKPSIYDIYGLAEQIGIMNEFGTEQ